MGTILISDIVDLQLMYDDWIGGWSGDTYELTNDIDASATKVSTYGTATDTSGVGNIGNTGGEGFLPIGNSTNEFDGNFDGKGFRILNLYINRTTPKNGLFGVIKNVANAIGNVGFIDAEFHVANTTGILGGLFQGLTTIVKSYSTGTINTSGSWCGGLLGIAKTVTVSECYSEVVVTGDNGNLGGFLARTTDAATFNNCYATGDVTGTDLNVGGFVGQKDQNAATMTNCYSIGAVNGGSNEGGFCGLQETGTCVNCYYDSQTSGQSDNTGKGTPKTTAQMKTQGTFTNWDFDAVWSMVDYPELLVFITDLPYKPWLKQGEYGQVDSVIFRQGR